MVSTIIVCQPNKAQTAIEKHLDYSWNPSSPFHHHITAPKTTIGIDQIRQLISVSKHTPPKDKTRVIWLENAHSLTHQAQNALLKILEEPPAQTHIVLTSHTVHPLLPTIRSRCHIIHHHSKKQAESSKEDIVTLLKKLNQSDFSKAVKLAQSQPTKRKEVIKLTTSITNELRKQLRKHPEEKHLRKLQSAIKTHQYLNANVNPRLCLEYFFIQLSI